MLIVKATMNADFDNGFNLTDMSALSNNARGKSLALIERVFQYGLYVVLVV